MTPVHSTHEFCGEWKLELIQPLPNEMKCLRDGAGSGGLRFLVAMTALGTCAPADEPRKPEQTSLRVGQLFPIARLNPVLPAEGFDAEGNYLVFDRLAFLNADGELVGGLLERWQPFDGGRRFVLTLRPGIRFHDGTVASAEDLVFTFDAIRDLQNHSVYGALLSFVDGVDRVDDRSVSVRLRHPYWHFVELLDFGVLPAHLLKGVRLDAASFNEHPIGAGPFRVAKIQDGFVDLERFADYYGAKAGLERLTVTQYESDQLWRRLLAHHIDAALNVPWSKHRFLGHLGTIKTDESTRLYAVSLCFIRTHKPFDSVRVRRAFAAAIDRKRIVEKTEFGFGIPTERLDSHAFSSIPYELENARRELGGRIVRLGVYGTDSDEIDVAMELQRQLSAADVTLKISPDRESANVDVVFCGFQDPAPIEVGAYKFGSAFDPNLKDVDAIFERIAETQDDTIRHALFQQAEGRVFEEEPLTILFWQPLFSAYRAEYCGYHMVNVFDGLEKMRPCP
jgi:ABC-type transport system substrate-binding protein